MNEFSLIETFGWSAASGFKRLEQHLIRLQNSAEKLEFKFVRTKIINDAENILQTRLNSAGNVTNSNFRIRIELSKDGQCGVQCVPFEPMPSSTFYRLAIANNRLSSTDEFLRHKTTMRASYERAREAYSREEVDEVLLCNEKEELCEGTITNLFVRPEPDSKLLTPAATCGLLPGILRGELLHSGEAKEAILSPVDLETAHEIFVGNSLRGLIRAHLVTV